MASQHEKPDAGLFGWLSRKLAPPETPADEAVEERPDAWPSFVPLRRRPKPLMRVVRWEPDDSESGSDPVTKDDWELFMSQELLLEVRQHLAAAPEHEAFGFLVGRLYYCPWTKSSYVLGDGVLKSSDSLASGQNEAQFRDIWHAAWKEARGQDAEIIGWYHRHGLLGVQLSQHDVELHKTFFPEPWQSALVLVLGRAGNRGGLVRRAEGQLFFNRNLTGFYELAGPDVDWTEDARPTVLDWDNHSARNGTRLLDLPELPDSQEMIVEPAGAESGGEMSAVEGSDATADGEEAVTAPLAEDAPLESDEAQGAALELDEGGPTDFVDAIQPLSGYNPVEGSIDHSVSQPDTQPADVEPGGPQKATPKRKRRRSGGARLDPTDPDLAEFFDVIRGPAPYAGEPAEAPVGPRDIPLAGPAPEPVETRHEPERVAPDHPKRESSEEAASPGRRVERGARALEASEGLPFLLETEETSHDAQPAESTIRSLVEQIDEILALSGLDPQEPAAAEPTAPETGSAEPAAPRPAAPPPVQDRRRDSGTVRSPVDSEAAPRLPYDHGTPVVMLSESHMRVPDLLRRHWKLTGGVAAVALVAIVMILRAVTGEAPTDPALLRPAAVTAYSDIQLQQLGRAMAQQIVEYDERRTDFELGRIDCASLALGHTEISQAFTVYSERFAIVGTRLPAADRLEYQRLAGEARTATLHFEQAGCASR